MRSLPILALLLALSLVALAPPPVPTLTRPSWSPGDSWTYRTNTTIVPGLNLTGTVTSTVQGRTSVVVGDGTVEAFDVLVSGSGTAGGTVTTPNGTFAASGSWIITGRDAFEPVNLELISGLLDLDVNGSVQGFPFTARVQNTTTFEVVSDQWQYPLYALGSGNRSVRLNFTQDTYSTILPHVHQEGLAVWNLSFEIATPTTLSTPAGSFRVFPVTETWPDGSVERSYPSPAVGNDAQTASYGPDGNLTAVTVLTAYRYQALEPPTYLGLTLVQWAIVVPVIAAVPVGFLIYRRYRQKRRPRPPKGWDLTSGPRGP